MGNIFFMEKNLHGAWVVYGVLGVKQYYDYTKEQAREKYLAECESKIFYLKVGL